METELLTFQPSRGNLAKLSSFLVHLSVYLVCLIYLLTDLVKFFVLAITS